MMAFHAFDGRAGRQFRSSEREAHSQVPDDERRELVTARVNLPTRPPPISFQDFLPASLIAPPIPPNESVSPRAPKIPQSTQDYTPPPRSLFAQLARKATPPKVKEFMNSFRSSKSRDEPSKPDPVAVALMWAETASTSKSSLSDTSSSNFSHGIAHDPNHKHKSSAGQTNSRSDSVEDVREWSRNKTPRSSIKAPPIRTVRFKEEEEFIPTPPWTPSLSTWSLNSTDSVDRSSTNDDDSDSRPNETLALAAIERAPVAHARRDKPELHIIPLHSNVMDRISL
ncbi:hypothetical protein E1B28_012376 [Marasmius oreades]|nr:uncharacterized protein E1B28_012376 [Marasmius oreades]KAG7088374.1 hypothetical protein E1B28_012376 [Marasmius oreades]